jgi:hypothetical protein
MPRTKDLTAPQLIKACTSLDELTLTLLEKIRHKFQLTKVKASKMIVGLALEKRIKLVDVTKFYQEVWSNLSFESGQRFSQLRLDWTPEENALLLIYAKHLFSSNNRSEAVRVLITYYAVQNKFAVVGQVKKSTIIPSKN